MWVVPSVCRDRGRRTSGWLGSESVKGGSTILRSSESGPLTSVLQGWCSGNPSRLGLVYRASRDDWSPKAFLDAKRNRSPCTITLIKIGDGDDSSASIVGGYSGVPVGRGHPSRAFLFMLKSGKSGDPTTFQPVQWGIGAGSVMLPHDLGLSWSGNSCTVRSLT
ncbi:unnamed protein product [Pylaiella littoralis]